jgi:hypothetical protein
VCSEEELMTAITKTEVASVERMRGAV